ncbi:MAG TPA: YkvA family protein, partial [Aestuariivirga sp.]|nr:YkvA family protein [Aestuariivirga sp.]
MDITRNEASVKRDFFPKLKRVLANVPFAEDVVAAYYCAFDPATPAKAKGILLGALAYFIMPIDIIPDFIVGLGF